MMQIYIKLQQSKMEESILCYIRKLTMVTIEHPYPYFVMKVYTAVHLSNTEENILCYIRKLTITTKKQPSCSIYIRIWNNIEYGNNTNRFNIATGCREWTGKHCYYWCSYPFVTCTCRYFSTHYFFYKKCIRRQNNLWKGHQIYEYDN